jgi:hypothetical protein
MKTVQDVYDSGWQEVIKIEVVEKTAQMDINGEYPVKAHYQTINSFCLQEYGEVEVTWDKNLCCYVSDWVESIGTNENGKLFDWRVVV